MSDLEAFAKLTNEQGGEWWSLERRGRYSLHMCQGKYLGDDWNYYYTTPVYQIFKDGTRIYTNTNYREAWEFFIKLVEESEKWEETENE